MISAVLITASLCVAMLLPYLPGRFDASATTLSFSVQIASYVSLLMVPVGLAWLVNPVRARLWQTLALVSAGLAAFLGAIAAAAVNQLSMGVILGIGAILLLRKAYRDPKTCAESAANVRSSIPYCLAAVPLFLVTFRATVLPRAADWSRSFAVQHSSPLISQIESFRQRRGHYPISLQSLNHDVPTGIMGIERFHYEPNGEAYNVFFVRPHIALDAKEVVMFNPRDEHRFASHELDILQHDGKQLDLRRGDRRRTQLAQPHWVSILFD